MFSTQLYIISIFFIKNNINNNNNNNNNNKIGVREETSLVQANFLSVEDLTYRWSPYCNKPERMYQILLRKTSISR